MAKVNFKIELENIIDPNIVSTINMIFALTHPARSLSELNHFIVELEIDPKVLIFGNSGSHLWISYPNGSRIFLITSI